MVSKQIKAEDCVITDNKSLHELLTRHGRYLPAFNSKWSTKAMLLAARVGNVFTFT